MSSALPYRVDVKRSAQRELAALPRRVQQRVLAALAGLAENPRPAGTTKLGGGGNLYRLRIAGDYRVVWQVNDGARTVVIARIGHRRDVYRGL